MLRVLSSCPSNHGFVRTVCWGGESTCRRGEALENARGEDQRGVTKGAQAFASGRFWNRKMGPKGATPARRALLVPAPMMPRPSKEARATSLSASWLRRDSVSIVAMSGLEGRSSASVRGTAARTSASAYESRCSSIREAILVPSSSPIAMSATPTVAALRCAFCAVMRASQCLGVFVGWARHKLNQT
jgi:hypothetical protein